MYPSPNLVAQLGIFVLGFILGVTVSLQFFQGGFDGHWAAFAGAGGGAIITVIGLWWLEARKNAREDEAKSRTMVPDLIVLRGRFRGAIQILVEGRKRNSLPLKHLQDQIDSAYVSWQNIQPVLVHFPDTAIDSYRLTQSFLILKENDLGFSSEEIIQQALNMATRLATRFKVDDVDLG